MHELIYAEGYNPYLEGEPIFLETAPRRKRGRNPNPDVDPFLMILGLALLGTLIFKAVKGTWPWQNIGKPNFLRGTIPIQLPRGTIETALAKHHARIGRPVPSPAISNDTAIICTTY